MELFIKFHKHNLQATVDQLIGVYKDFEIIDDTLNTRFTKIRNNLDIMTF
jgi:hypothetical protein